MGNVHSGFYNLPLDGLIRGSTILVANELTAVLQGHSPGSTRVCILRAGPGDLIQ
jgi:hypothetical protein